MVPEIFRFASSFKTLAETSSDKKAVPASIGAEIEKMKLSATRFFKNYSPSTDQKLLGEMVDEYGSVIGFSKTPASFQHALKKFPGDGASFAKELFSASFLDNQKEVMDFLDEFKRGSEKKLLKDPAFKIAIGLDEYGEREVYPVYNLLRNEVNILNRDYISAQMEVMKERKFYPDANLSLRITYGKVEGYEARDGIQYEYFTTLNGVMEKMSPEIEDYKVPDRLQELYRQKDFGAYADASGNLRTCFIASNHTTGGNSGSPVMDGDGRLVGINFDRVWEGTMSDLYFDPELCRNISLDIRYMLFIIDKYAGAGYLLEEMELVK